MKKVFSLMLSLMMLLSIFAVSTQSYAAEYVADSEASSMLTTINSLRTGSDAWYWNEDNKTKTTFSNLAAYKYDVNLAAIAKIRAKELETSFSHTRPDGTDFFTCTVKDANGKEVKTFGENIAAGTNMDADLAFNQWLEANEMYAGQGHRRNMLSPKFTCIGIAAFKSDDGKTYWVQEFGKTLSAQEKATPAPVTPVAKKANTLTVKAKAPAVKYSKLKKKNQTIALKNWATVSKAQGKVTYKKSSGNKKITVSKAGKITVKKGLKKGTYKVKIKVSAAGNNEYNAAVKTVTVKIKVK